MTAEGAETGRGEKLSTVPRYKNWENHQHQQAQTSLEESIRKKQLDRACSVCAGRVDSTCRRVVETEPEEERCP